MHYHYFTLEQREALARRIQEVARERGENPAPALERLHTPEFGLCAVCGTDIAFARLEQDPFERTCGHCVHT